MHAEIDITGADEKDVDVKVNALRRAIQIRGVKAVPSTAKWEGSQSIKVVDVVEKNE